MGDEKHRRKERETTCKLCMSLGYFENYNINVCGKLVEAGNLFGTADSAHENTEAQV